jgi:hypothetical protein
VVIAVPSAIPSNRQRRYAKLTLAARQTLIFPVQRIDSNNVLPMQ